MFYDIFEKLGQEYEEIKKLINKKKLYDAYVLLKGKNDSISLFLISLILILLNKHKDALEKLLTIKDDELFFQNEIVAKDIVMEIIGNCYYEMKSYMEAAKYYMKSLDIECKNFYSNYNLANIYIIYKDYEKAYNILVKLSEEKPDDLNILKNIKLLENVLKKTGK